MRLPEENAAIAHFQEKYETLVISDVHLGMAHAGEDLLYSFLKFFKPKRLILNGDIIDGLHLVDGKASGFPEGQKRTIDVVNRMIAEGVEVVYIPGNHDEELRAQEELFGTDKVFGMTFKKSMDLTLPGDEAGTTKKIYIAHGDEFDSFEELPDWLVNGVYEVFLAVGQGSAHLDRATHALLGVHADISAKFEEVVQSGVTKTFKDTAVSEVYKRGEYDGIICGHIHVSDADASGAVTYHNSGTWLNGSTGAIGITAKGRIEKIDWKEIIDQLGLKRDFNFTSRPNPDVAHRPATERMLEAVAKIWGGHPK